MKILVADSIAEVAIDILKTYFEVDVKEGQNQEQLKSIIGQYDALIVRSATKVTAPVLEAGKKLQVVGRAGVGVDNIDVEAATRFGILVVNSPEGNIVSTAEHTIAMLLSVARNIPKANAMLHNNVWDRKLKGIEMRNKTLGIIGLGRVGTEVSQIAKGLKMNVIAYDPLIAESRAERLGVKLVDLETLIKQSDFITVHVPLISSTRGLIGAEQLKMMKPTAMVVNCARGGIIDEEALYDALTKGIIAGAAIDVYTQEPAKDNILLKSDKAVLTPHLAASTAEAEISAGKDLAEQVVAVLRGGSAKTPVNAPMIPSEAMAVVAPYIDIGTTIGRIAMQLITGHPESLTIHYQGDIAKEVTGPIKVAILGGLLEMMTEERVNIVNADILAANRGIRITEEKDTTCENYTSMVTLEVSTKSAHTLLGATSLRGKTYLTRMDDYFFEIEPSSSYLLFTEHKDRPGMIGKVGTIIGDADINISQMQVCIGLQRGGKAMMVICLEEPLPPKCYQKIQAIPDIYKTVMVKVTGS